MKRENQKSADKSRMTDRGMSQARMASDIRRSSGSFELVFSILIFAGLGYLLDSVLEMLPLFTILFSIMGFLGGTISIIYRYKHAMNTNAGQSAKSSTKI